ncbi:uncharacterized protein C3orf22 homolog isoform X1 [Prionailurus viverrinus]|uniref:uncharacterized protein C3orf22 homolog isoform X1 n=1 Tax=Prionailurus viverrinus TaxID=61388 RepID=UPI001FF28B8E|nr:uncharacterized protein C3orf22 homolog isoform X1 [Prionailurus viverrinus]XP_047705299.1 uncharacterized protein C3orf22 homolog isoform X1 [Prionailurus viverrinus]XP_047705300.1 uncharacterized protein C3orf22 homolog isoform X1 [Prionailurus viverrinus]
MMRLKDPKKYPQHKKRSTKIRENFARKFPYRFSWLTAPNAEFPKPWEATKRNDSLRDQLPLQKMLVPTRSIPVRGLGAPDFTSPSSLSPPPLLPPQNYLWEFKLLSHRFPGSGVPAALTGAHAAHPSRGLS